MNNNFKIKDENGIERDATGITCMELDGNKYLIYSIDRDQENSNIFVSKYNSDGVTLEDIIDINEKNKVDEVVKELIKIPLM